MTRRLPPPLLALSPGDLVPASVPGFLAGARAAVGAGLAGVLVREPRMGDRALLELALEVRAILGDAGWLGIHDRPHVAPAARADGVHLGFRSLPPAEARRILPERLAIGFSAHAGDDEALWPAADYLFFGPVRETPSKTGLKDPVGFEELARAAARSPVPVWAIGGMREEDAEACRAAGCAGIAMRRGILRAIG